MTDQGVPGHTGKKTYVLTFDLPQKIKLFRSVGINTPESDDPIFADIQANITEMISHAFPNDNVRAVTMETLADDILSKAMDHRRHLTDAKVISTCSEIAGPKHGQTIEINRLIDRDGGIIGLGPRPGHTDLFSQIQAIANVCGDSPAILMEDGTFTGSTLIKILKMLKEARVEVAAVVVGFAFAGALQNIKKEFEGDVIIVEEMEDFIDWMPDHDFFPFTPNCGRVIGVPWNGYNLPFYTYNHASYSVPYLIPFCPMTDWTSIPRDYALQISLYCLQKNLELFSRINDMNDKQVTIADLMGVYPRVSIPISVGQSRLPHLNASVTSFLSDLCHEL